MGIQTHITLQEVQKLFPAFEIKSLQETTAGVMDTTYILDKYILKKYERNIQKKVEEDTKILHILKKNGLNVPSFVSKNGEWYLYEKLCGTMPKDISLFHIQSLARFLSKMHRVTQNIQSSASLLESYDILDILNETQTKFYSFYKKLQSLKTYTMKNDGFIHGDIFRDNTLFDGKKIAVFDFIDGANGSFTFDLGVALLSFNPHKRRLYTKLFINTYNQRAPKKVQLRDLETELSNAAKLYGLLRLQRDNNVKNAKLLEKFW